MKRILFIIFLFGLNFWTVFSQQNQVELIIEPLYETEAYDIKGGSECHPGDIIITIKSDISNLTFDSNVMDLVGTLYDSQKGEYIFCHNNESFWLTISSSKHISKKTYIDGKNAKYAFRVVEKAALGKLYFKTKPNNALADFGFSGQSPQLTGMPIEMNAGEYKVRISKHGYMPIDTFVIVPSDGNIRQLDLVLKPDFAKIQLDISTTDNSTFNVFPLVEIDTAHVNLAYLVNSNQVRTYDDADNLQFFKLYQGGSMPVPPGNYSVVVSAPGYRTQTSRISASKGTVTPLAVKLEPISGYLTVSDQSNAIGAKIFLDDEYIGDVPLYRYKTKIGNKIIRIVKEGYISSEKEYQILSEEGKEIDLNVSMSIYKQFRVESNPAGSEILVDGVRQGFTPKMISLNKGVHEIVIKRNGFLDFKQKIEINDDRTLSVDTVHSKLEINNPIQITSERNALSILIKRGKEIVLENVLTPADVQLPIGKYKMKLLNDKRVCFSGSINHNGKNSINAPVYSRGTFTTLVGDYFISSPKIITPGLSVAGESLYSRMANVHFGRFNVFPGFSTSILKTSVFKANQGVGGTPINTSYGTGIVENEDNTAYSEYMFAASLLFLNGELRVGLPIFKQLDVAAVGTYTFYPQLTKVIPYSHVSGQDIFCGIELSSRISVLNANIKIGQQKLIDGKYNFLVTPSSEFSFANHSGKYNIVAFNQSQFIISIGFTLGQSPARGNNMIRVLKKPLFTNY